MAVDRWLTASVEAEDNVDSGGAAVTVTRAGSLASLALPPEDDALYAGFVAACTAVDRAVPERLAFSVDSGIPVARGLGSSSAALVAGARLANAALELGLDVRGLAELCTRIEGHPTTSPLLFSAVRCSGVPATAVWSERWTFAPSSRASQSRIRVRHPTLSG